MENLKCQRCGKSVEPGRALRLCCGSTALSARIKFPEITKGEFRACEKIRKGSKTETSRQDLLSRSVLSLEVPVAFPALESTVRQGNEANVAERADI